MSEKRKAPSIRFTFSGEWIEKRVEEIAPLQRGFDLPVSQIVEGEYPVVFSNGILKFHLESKVKAPGIVTGRSGTIGKVTYVEKDFWPHNTSLWVTNFFGNDPRFIYYFYSNLKLERFGTGSGVPTLNRNDIHVLEKRIPSLPEQQMIAEFLTAVDRRIELLQAKKEKLEAYKKGVMQKIFAQKLRFKSDDGTDFPDWEERKLGEVAKFSKGKGISKSDISEDGSQECIRYGELYTDYAEVIDLVLSRTELDSSTLVLSQANDVIIPSSGETQIDIARAACVLRSGIALGGDLNIIRSTLNGVFLSFYLNHRKKHEIAKMAQGISVVHLYNSQLEHLQVEIPTPEEQAKIVQFLTGLDRSIKNLNQQITHTQTWKKGLLQKMFV